MNLLETKFMSMTVLGLVSIILGMIPVFIIRKLKLTVASVENRSQSTDAMSPFTQAVISGMLCFGGGVLMGTGFLHMLPEVNEGWQRYMQVNNIDINLPLGIVVICAGFFLVYFVEELAHLVADRHAHNKVDVSLHRAMSIRGCPVSLEGPSPPCESSACQKSDGETCQDSTICQLDCDDKEYCRDVNVGGCSSSKTSCFSKVSSQSSVVQSTTCSDNSLHNDGYGTFSAVQKDIIHCDKERQPESDNCHLMNINVCCANKGGTQSVENNMRQHVHNIPLGNNHSHSLHHHHGLIDGHCVGAPLRGLLFVIALSLHEILEGVAVGLQKNQSGVLQLFAAIASHKFVIAFCVGLELSTSGVKFMMRTVYILIFSLVTPIGIAFGIFITNATSDEGNPADSLGSLIMEALACGTILYVAFFEILERERSKSTVGLFQWTLLVLGFVAIMCLQLIAVEPDVNAINAETVQVNSDLST